MRGWQGGSTRAQGKAGISIHCPVQPPPAHLQVGQCGQDLRWKAYTCGVRPACGGARPARWGVLQAPHVAASSTAGLRGPRRPGRALPRAALRSAGRALATVFMAHPVLHPGLPGPVCPPFSPVCIFFAPVSPCFSVFPRLCPGFPPISPRFPPLCPPPPPAPVFPHFPSFPPFPPICPFSLWSTMYQQVYPIWVHPGPAHGACPGVPLQSALGRALFTTLRLRGAVGGSERWSEETRASKRSVAGLPPRPSPAGLHTACAAVSGLRVVTANSGARVPVLPGAGARGAPILRRNLSDYRGTGEMAPFVDCTFECGVAIAALSPF